MISLRCDVMSHYIQVLRASKLVFARLKACATRAFDLIFMNFVVSLSNLRAILIHVRDYTIKI